MISKISKFVIPVFFSILLLFRVFSGISSSPIERWDEQTNINVVEQTAYEDSFPVLMFSGKPFFEKPPVWYYVSLVFLRSNNNATITLRYISAIFGTIFILLIITTAWKWWGQTAGYISFFLLITTHHLFINNPSGIFSTHTLKSADVDSMFLFLLSLSFVFALNFHISKQMAIVTGFISGLTILTKGPLGIIPLLLSTALSFKSMGNKHRIHILYAFTVLFLTILPWYLFMTAKFGTEFLSTNLGYHVFERIRIPLEGHENSPWYYLRLLSNPSIFPYGFLFLVSGIWLFIGGTYKSEKRIVYSLLMSIICLIIPTLTQTKLAWYILPFYPFAILTIAGVVSTFFLRKRK